MGFINSATVETAKYSGANVDDLSKVHTYVNELSTISGSSIDTGTTETETVYFSQTEVTTETSSASYDDRIKEIDAKIHSLKDELTHSDPNSSRFDEIAKELKELDSEGDKLSALNKEWTSYQDAADAGYSDVMTASEFYGRKEAGNDYVAKYDSYEDYLAAMKKKYTIALEVESIDKKIGSIDEEINVVNNELKAANDIVADSSLPVEKREEALLKVKELEKRREFLNNEKESLIADRRTYTDDPAYKSTALKSEISNINSQIDQYNQSVEKLSIEIRALMNEIKNPALDETTKTNLMQELHKREAEKKYFEQEIGKLASEKVNLETELNQI